MIFDFIIILRFRVGIFVYVYIYSVSVKFEVRFVSLVVLIEFIFVGL